MIILQRKSPKSFPSGLSSTYQQLAEITFLKLTSFPIFHIFAQSLISTPVIILDRISYRFVTGKLNIAFEAEFKDPALGGLGIIKSMLFVQALRVGMFKKALNSMDTWAKVRKSF